MLTVAFFTHSARPSGAELLVGRVAAAMTRVRPIVILGEHGPLEPILRERGIETLVVPLRAREGGRVRPWGYARGLAATLRARGVERIYTHSAKAHLLGGIAGRLARIPVISHAHDLLGAPAHGPLPSLALRTAFATLPSARIANSTLTKQSAGWVARLAWATVACPIDTPKQAAPPSAEQAQAPGQTIRLLALGRITEWKGQHLAIQALATLRAAGFPVELDIAGGTQFPGDDEYLARLEQTVGELGLTPHVRFLGHVDRPDEIMRGADIVLHTSTRPEPFGQVIIESLAAGRPTVVASNAGAAELLTPGVDCETYPAGSASGLALAIRRLINDPTRRTAVGTAAIASASRFTTDRIVPEIENLLIATRK
ncbi:MAG: glycosyltransferase family 4 protein [Leucobacter sp.]